MSCYFDRCGSFSEVIGLKSPLTYEDLESGLVDLGPPLPAEKPLDKVEAMIRFEPAVSYK